MFFGHCRRTRFRDSFCLASMFEMTVYLLTYFVYTYVHDSLLYHSPTLHGYFERTTVFGNCSVALNMLKTVHCIFQFDVWFRVSGKTPHRGGVDTHPSLPSPADLPAHRDGVSLVAAL